MWENVENYLKVPELETGKVYKVFARNFEYAVWDGVKYFIGVRNKFGSKYLSGEIHWDLDESFGTCKPEKIVCDVPPDIEITYTSKDLFNFLEGIKDDKR
jgi:hypothetical protein